MKTVCFSLSKIPCVKLNLFQRPHMRTFARYCRKKISRLKTQIIFRQTLVAQISGNVDSRETSISGNVHFRGASCDGTAAAGGPEVRGKPGAGGGRRRRVLGRRVRRGRGGGRPQEEAAAQEGL